MSKRVITLLAIFAFAGFLVACGDDDDDGGEEAQSAQTSASSISVEPRSIGVVNLVRQSPAEDKIDRFYEATGEALGWQFEIVDGGGDPSKIARAVQSFLNQNVDAILMTSTEASIIRGQLQEAKQKGIPVINTNGGTTPSDLYTAQYEEDEYKMGKQLADYMKETLEDPQIGNLSTSIAYSGVLRNDALHDVFPNEIVAEQEVDLTNPVVDTENVLNGMLTADPDINAVWAVYDNMSQASVSTIESKRSEAQLFNYFTTEQNVENLRAETPLQAVSDVNLPHTGGVAVDQLLSFFQKDEPINPDALVENPLTYEVVTRDNIEDLLGDKAELYPNEEILQPFLDQWAKEYPAQ
jgi:ABC-type sugar transport system substrate-binding protein